MASRDEQDFLAAAAFGEVETTGALGVSVSWAAMEGPRTGVRAPRTSTVGCRLETCFRRLGLADRV